MDTETARTRLEEMLADLQQSARTLRDEGAHENSELSTYDQHQADTATLLSDADREDAVIEALQVQEDEVRRAIARIDAGTYGRCVECGQELVPERLDARPEAARCRDCQAKLESRR